MGFLSSRFLIYIIRILSQALNRYLRYVKPSFDNFVGPTAKHADIVRNVDKFYSIVVDEGLRLSQEQTTVLRSN